MKTETFEKAAKIQSEIDDINTQLERLQFMEKTDWVTALVNVGNCTIHISRVAYDGILADIKKNLLKRHTELVAEFESL
jgi:hypothetical protein